MVHSALNTCTTAIGANTSPGASAYTVICHFFIGKINFTQKKETKIFYSLPFSSKTYRTKTDVVQATWEERTRGD